MNLDVQWTCEELISALIEGGAQGALITGLIWGLLKLCPRVNAATRHGAWFATLLIVAFLPAAHFMEAVSGKLKDSAAAFEPTISAPPLATPEVPLEEAIVSVKPLDEPAIAQVEMDPAPAPLAPTDAAPEFKWTIPFPKKLSLILVGCWLLLLIIRLGGLASQLVLLRSIKRRAEIAPEVLAGSFADIVASMRLSRRPQVLISDDATAPMVVGFFHPAMLLPKFVATKSNAIQLEHLFRHELAHLARRDDWTNLIQQAIAAILFFNPAVLFLSRRLTAEREIACDDHALAISRAPREYALFLTEFASQMKSRDFTAAPAAWSSNSQLKERIGMILNGKRNASPRVSRAGVGAITAAALTLALLALAATPRFVVAAETPVIEKTEVAPETTTVVSVQTSVEPIELAIATEPVEIPDPVVSVEPLSAQPRISIASTTSPAREKPSLSPLRNNLNINVAQPAQPGQPARVAMTPQPVPAPAPEPAPHPRVKIARADRDDGDLEHRLDRLERMVEDLMKREKRDREGKENPFFGKPASSASNYGESHAEMDRAKREMERAHRDAENAVRGQSEQKQAMKGQWNGDPAGAGLAAARESLKARRHALEAQRKQIDKELDALEKEMKQQDEKRDQEREKRNKPEEKEKKHRDGGKTNSDEENAQ
jgi:beta-lactamase regulating signal transducer with metallopeptidase domain